MNTSTQKQTSEINRIQTLILQGYSPADLMDSRVFPNPYSSSQIWGAILSLKLNQNGEAISNAQ